MLTAQYAIPINRLYRSLINNILGRNTEVLLANNVSRIVDSVCGCDMEHILGSEDSPAFIGDTAATDGKILFCGDQPTVFNLAGNAIQDSTFASDNLASV